jgi:hypothetical protein
MAIQPASDMEKARGRRNLGVALIFLGLATLVAIFWGFWLTSGRSPLARDEMGVSVRELSEDPGRFVGSKVKVTGELGQVVGPGAFSLIGAGEFRGEGILVVGTRGFPPRDDSAQAGEDLFLQVTGPVRIFDEAAREEFAAYLGQGDPGAWLGKPVLVAEDLVRAAWLDESGGVGVEPEGGSMGGAVVSEPGQAISLAYVIENVNSYYGDTVTVDGFVVEKVAPEAFAMTAEPVPGGQSTLVVAHPDRIPDLRPGGRIRVTGVVRRFELETMRRELGSRMDPAPYGAWRFEPSIVASSIEQR